MMWVGMLGISMAQYAGRHLQVDAVRRALPERWRPIFRKLSSLAAIALLVFLGLHALDYLHDNWREWLETDMTAGVFESLPIPYWVASQPIATALFLMIARNLGELGREPATTEMPT